MKSLRSYSIVLSGVLLLAGCRMNEHSPTVDILGSYFPAWMVCIVAGLALVVVAKQLFAGWKIDAHLRPAPLVYLCLMILFTLLVWLFFFKN